MGDDTSGEVEDMCFVYPMLQPVAPAASTSTVGSGTVRQNSGGSPGALPWSSSTGFLRFGVFFANPFNRYVSKALGESLPRCESSCVAGGWSERFNHPICVSVW